jgi:hypothetical protein
VQPSPLIQALIEEATAGDNAKNLVQGYSNGCRCFWRSLTDSMLNGLYLQSRQDVSNYIKQTLMQLLIFYRGIIFQVSQAHFFRGEYVTVKAGNQEMIIWVGGSVVSPISLG